MTFTASLEDIVAENHNGLLTAHSSWERVKLLEVATVLNGFAFPSRLFSRNSGVPLLRIRDVRNDRTEAHFTGDFDPTYWVEPGDLVVGMDGDFHCTLWRGARALLNQRVCRVTPKEHFMRRRFLAYALPGYLSAINDHTSSMTVKHLSSRTVEDIPLPLPPLAEQDRIVAEIEKHFTRLDAAVASLQRARANLKRYRASVLRAACEGRLVPTEAQLARQEGRTYEPASVLLERILKERRDRWETQDKRRGKYRDPQPPDTSNLPPLPEGWVWATVEQLAWRIQYGTSAKANSDANGVPVLRMGNIQEGRLDLSDLKYLPSDHPDVAPTLLDDGDLLFNRTNSAELVGKTAVFRSNHQRGSFASYLIRVSFLEECSPEYVSTFINSDHGRAYIRSVQSQQVGQANVNGTKLAQMPIPVPPFAEQRRIVAEVERHLSVIQDAENVVEANLKRAERLRQAILQRAFQGKLVPQDPTDEPASVLLERIRKEREQAEWNISGTRRRIGRRSKPQEVSA